MSSATPLPGDADLAGDQLDRPDADSPSGTQDASPRIEVRGEAFLETEPELAEITVVTRVDGADRGQVLDLLGERRRAYAAVLDGYGPAIARHEIRTQSVQPRPEVALSPAGPLTPVVSGPLGPGNGNGGARAGTGGHLGTATLRVVVADFTMLGELVAGLAELGAAEFRGPRWMLPPGSEVYRRARRVAVRDALARGRDYAEALGCRLLRLVELADDGLTTTPVAYGSRRGDEALVEEEMLQAGSLAPLVSVVPERQRVRVRVVARFATSTPMI